MPLHAQIATIGGNAFFALIFLIAVPDPLAQGAFGLALFLVVLAAAAGYSCWVLIKFRHYLSAEAAIERELHVERLLAEVAALKAKAPG